MTCRLLQETSLGTKGRAPEPWNSALNKTCRPHSQLPVKAKCFETFRDSKGPGCFSRFLPS